MKKIILVLCMVVILSSMTYAGTEVDVEWDGSGDTDIVVGNADAETEFHTGGGHIQGTFHAKDYKDNPYNYGIDTFDVEVVASTQNGGYIHTWTNRLTSKSSMYGNAGQTTKIYVESDDTTELAFGSRTNYASMVNAQYGREKTTTGRQIEATGNYWAYHALYSGYGDYAQVEAIGSGSMRLKMMGEKTWYGSANMGHLPVCGDNLAWANNYATYQAENFGNLYVDGHARNSVSVSDNGMVIPGDGSQGSAQYHLHIQHGSDFSYNDFGLLVQ